MEIVLVTTGTVLGIACFFSFPLLFDCDDNNIITTICDCDCDCDSDFEFFYMDCYGAFSCAGSNVTGRGSLVIHCFGTGSCRDVTFNRISDITDYEALSFVGFAFNSFGSTIIENENFENSRDSEFYSPLNAIHSHIEM